MRTTSDSAQLGLAELLAYDAKQLAEGLGVSVRHIRRMDASGTLPRPVRFGRAKRWVAETVRAWLRAGSPPRADWESKTFYKDREVAA